MNISPLRIIGCAIFLLSLVDLARSAEQPKSDRIPLNTIWAWDMPGTKDIRTLEPDLFANASNHLSSEEQLLRSKRSILNQCVRPLVKLPDKPCEPAFAVLGTGLEALKNAHAILAEKEEPKTSYSTHDKVSIVFFSRLFGTNVHLKDVKRLNNRIDVQYQFVPHMESQETVNLALIPLDNLAAGPVEVSVVRLPQDKKFDVMSIVPVSPSLESRVVCKSFKFAVEEKKQ